MAKFLLSLPLALMLAAPPLSVQAAPGAISCPQRIQTEQSMARVDGWTTDESTDTGQALVDAIIWNGPPSYRKSKVVSPTIREGEIEDQHSWTLPDSPAGNWITCFYRATRFSLVRRLPDSIRTCEGVVEHHWGPHRLMSITCRP